ncbi:MAG: beta-ketoacyl-[Bacteroidales bacterium]|nr:beta-ketoacyl-[acyl-carrier-protein] synthase family protein [Bacteroidales bacterium]
MDTLIHITGAGVVSAVGCGQGETLDALRRGRSGIGPVRFLRTAEKTFLVGEVPLSNEEMAARCGASPDLSRTSLMGILALREALTEAGLPDLTGIPLISGTTVGGMDKTEQTFPAYSPLHDCGASTDAIAAHFGGAPFATTLSTACSSAANAVIFGANLIRSGQADIVAVGGSESLSDFHLHGFGSLMILDTAPCRPFDATRAGLNLGEGAAFLILESDASVRRRGAASLAVLSGFGNACDAFHQTASSENGEGAFLAMQKALRMAGLRPEDIDYVNAHGTGTPNNDASESAALRRVFGDALPPISSTKAFTGHTTSASGSIEAVFCLLALREGFIPAQLNWTTADPACIVPSLGGPASLKHILCNAFGFGGNDSSLLISR